MTVISRDIVKEFGYDKLPKVTAKIKGYSGEVAVCSQLSILK